jgi:hypothetical protein
MPVPSAQPARLSDGVRPSATGVRMSEADNIAILESFGLKRVGAWELSDRYRSTKHLRDEGLPGIAFFLDEGWAKRRNVDYAFSDGSVVLYIGETTAGLNSRFAGYRYGNPKPGDTDNGVKRAIAEVLEPGRPVAIWASQPVATFAIGGLDVEVPASKPVEELLIARIKPTCNKKNLGRGGGTASPT